MKKCPAIRFYPGDWLRDLNLSACSLAARGLWIGMLCVMHRSPRYGYFLIGDRAPSVDEAARILGCTADEYSNCLAELERASVLSQTEDGTIYCSRMVRDGAKREEMTVQDDA